MAQIETYKTRKRIPTGAPLAHLPTDTSELKAKTQFFGELSEIAFGIGRKIEKADYTAQLNTGRASRASMLNALNESYRTNTKPDTYQPLLADTIKSMLSDIPPTISNRRAKEKLQQEIKLYTPKWEEEVQVKVWQRKKINIDAAVDNARYQATQKLDPRDKTEYDEAMDLIAGAVKSMWEIGVPKEQIEMWTEESLYDFEKRKTLLNALDAAEIGRFDIAKRMVENSDLEPDEKNAIFSTIKRTAANKKLEYDSYVEKTEQDFVGKYDKEQLTTDEVINSNLSATKKLMWKRLVDAQVEARLSGEVELNWDTYDRLQSMVEDYDAGNIEKEKVQEAISKEVGKTIPTTIARSLRDRLAVKDDPNDPMNRSDVKRGLSFLEDLETAEINAANKKMADYKEIRGLRQKYRNKKNELERWIRGQEKLTDKDIQNKTDEMTQEEAKEITLTWFEQVILAKKSTPFFGRFTGTTEEEKLAKKKIKELQKLGKWEGLTPDEQETIRQAFLAGKSMQDVLDIMGQ